MIRFWNFIYVLLYARKTHTCKYEWVACNSCCGNRFRHDSQGNVVPESGPGYDQYGNTCYDCKGKKVVSACATCSHEFEVRLRKPVKKRTPIQNFLFHKALGLPMRKE